jgi:hypothetical protein
MMAGNQGSGKMITCWKIFCQVASFADDPTIYDPLKPIL